MDPAKHVSMNKETGMYCVYNKKGEKVKEFKDKKDAVAYATKNHDALMKEAKVYSKPAKLDPKIAKHPKVKAAQRAHAKGDWDGNVDKEGDAVVHIMGKPYTVTKQESINTADKKPETYRKTDGKMGTRMVPTHKDVVKEGTEVGETKWAAVNMFAGGDKFGGRGVQITGLNGQGKANMELLKQKGKLFFCELRIIKILNYFLKNWISHCKYASSSNSFSSLNSIGLVYPSLSSC